jgi:hypothetical protein
MDALRSGDVARMLSAVEQEASTDLDGDGAIGVEGLGAFTRSPTCAYAVDPAACPYLTVGVRFTGPYRAFEILMPAGYRLANVDSNLYRADAPVGSCGIARTEASRDTLHCFARSALPGGTEVSTTITSGQDGAPDGIARLPDGAGAVLFMVRPAPSRARLFGGFPVVGP